MAAESGGGGTEEEAAFVIWGTGGAFSELGFGGRAFVTAVREPVFPLTIACCDLFGVMVFEFLGTPPFFDTT